ncbi:MAG: TIGR03905 family TSCPD domain-containing protein [Clostridiales bacterium]|jgi:uncharacterized protein (TIGR03905 family)|nr:TIGR03905 family TSCPD domain-containing protein [Clostridiales bacterium]
MEKSYAFSGTCARGVTFERTEDGKIRNIRFTGGCNGNLKGIASLCEGMPAEIIIRRLKGLKCGYKNTSCPDQFAGALEKDIQK